MSVSHGGQKPHCKSLNNNMQLFLLGQTTNKSEDLRRQIKSKGCIETNQTRLWGLLNLGRSSMSWWIRGAHINDHACLMPYKTLALVSVRACQKDKHTHLTLRGSFSQVQQGSNFQGGTLLQSFRACQLSWKQSRCCCLQHGLCVVFPFALDFSLFIWNLEHVPCSKKDSLYFIVRQIDVSDRLSHSAVTQHAMVHTVCMSGWHLHAFIPICLTACPQHCRKALAIAKSRSPPPCGRAMPRRVCSAEEHAANLDRRAEEARLKSLKQKIVMAMDNRPSVVPKLWDKLVALGLDADSIQKTEEQCPKSFQLEAVKRRKEAKVEEAKQSQTGVVHSDSSAFKPKEPIPTKYWRLNELSIPLVRVRVPPALERSRRC